MPPTEIALDKWDGELGVWFETSWDQKAILVKRVKKGKFSFNNTDIRVGDQLLFIDNAPVSRGMTFSDTMKLLKEKMLSARADEEQDNDIFSFSFTTNRLDKINVRIL